MNKYTPIPRTPESLSGYGLAKSSEGSRALDEIANLADERITLENRREELMARRAGIIAQLNEMKYTTPELSPEESDELEEQSLRAGAEAYMEHDPDTAYRWLQQAESLKVKRDTQKSIKDPDAIRVKLSSNLNALNGRISQADANDPTLQGMQALAKNIQRQIASDMPSLQQAYILLEESDKYIGDGVGGKDVPIGTTVSSLPSGVTAVGGEAIRNQKVSTTPTDWYKMVEEDGADKPVVYEGLSKENMPSNVEDKYDRALLNWSRNNKTAKSNASAAAAAAKGGSIADNFARGIPTTLTRLQSVATQISSLLDKFAKGDYNLANFADLKSTMADGRMTDSDVGLALGLSLSQGFFQNLKSWATGGKGGVEQLNDKDAARTAINSTIAEYNKTMSNMLNPKFSGKYAKDAQEAWDEKSYSTFFAALPPSFTAIPGGTPKPTPAAKPKPSPTQGATGRTKWELVQ